MSSKINDLNSRPTPVGAGSPVSKAKGVATGRSGTAQSSATDSTDVHITDSASRLATLEQAVRDMPAVDEARVAQIRTAIEQGSYQVQPDHVAGQLIQMERSLAQLPGTTDSNGQ